MQPTLYIRAQCIAHILVHHGQVEPFPIEISATPPPGVGVFGICLVRHDFQEALVTGDTPNIFGRPGARSIDAGPVLGSDLKRHEFLDHDGVAPVIAEVIDVIEHRSPREVAEANLTTIKDVGVVFIGILRQELDIAIAQAADVELVQMIVPPVEGRLKGKMQLPKIPA